MWVVQMCLPLLYPLYVLLDLCVGLTLHWLAERRLPPTMLLLRLGGPAR